MTCSVVPTNCSDANEHRETLTNRARGVGVSISIGNGKICRCRDRDRGTIRPTDGEIIIGNKGRTRSIVHSGTTDLRLRDRDRVCTVSLQRHANSRTVTQFCRWRNGDSPWRRTIHRTSSSGLEWESDNDQQRGESQRTQECETPGDESPGVSTCGTGNVRQAKYPVRSATRSTDPALLKRLTFPLLPIPTWTKFGTMSPTT
ncbi:unannotated protein [freshwater metagenome]|uniref:Unannotated protein n=1 Tax=freshwater metagenome TaxID=449393 RepID=A0A6J7MVU2_9ZZZZ